MRVHEYYFNKLCFSFVGSLPPNHALNICGTIVSVRHDADGAPCDGVNIIRDLELIFIYDYILCLCALEQRALAFLVGERTTNGDGGRFVEISVCLLCIANAILWSRINY